MPAKQVFFLGIGGIGMSALARWYNAHGAHVAGYDKTASSLTQELQKEGIQVDTTGEVKALPNGLAQDLNSANTENWLIVATPAVPLDFPLLLALQTAGFHIWKRAEILGHLTANRPLMAIAGTHGKTTTSTLLSHFLDKANIPVEAFLGGIAKGTGSNLLLAGQGSDTPWIVAEADEFDRSFLTLHPKHAVITSTDADHLDIYGSSDALRSAFGTFAEQVAPGGLLIHHDALESWVKESPSIPIPPHAQYGELEPGQSLEKLGWEAGYSEVAGESGRSKFTLHLQGKPAFDILWSLPGKHNAANATAAAAMAIRAGLDAEQLPRLLDQFPGISRRFEIRHNSIAFTVIDDYAHHPSEISGTIEATRLLYPNRKILGVFQPHLYSRTQDFLTDFANALSSLDECILLPIYAAREKPLPGIDAQAIGEKITGCPVKCPEESRFLDVLETCDPDVLLFMGAGDLHRWIPAAVARFSTSDSDNQNNSNSQP
jgi:UDP-N-acetylmuramate--alanine ligase